MKRFIFSSALLLLSVITFSQCQSNTIATLKNCPDTCIKLKFSSDNDKAPICDSIYSNGKKSNIEFGYPTKCDENEYSYTYKNGNIPNTCRLFFHIGNEIDSCDIILPPYCHVLPITISTFFAKRSDDNVTLYWKLQTENEPTIEIERAIKDNLFIKVGSTKDNSYTDNNNLQSSYRLKIIDKDGIYQYSSIISVDDFQGFSIFPNPSTNVVTINTNSKQNIQLIDNSGRIIKNIIVNNMTQLSLQKGVYFIRIIDKEKSTMKLIIN